MKLSIPCSCLLLLAGSTLSQAAFSPASNKAFVSRSTALNGYLDDITKDLYGEDPNPDLDAESRQKTRMENNEKDRYGPGNWKDFVDFDEFDGGDGQMGVAGDGQKGLEKSWKGEAKMGKSKMMSAKNAWGKDTGYAQQLIDEGIEATRAQQLENWQNQREVQGERNAHRFMTESFDRSEKLTGEEDWRTLKSFGVERNQEFDLDETFGPVVAGSEILEIVELHSRINAASVHEFNIKNSFMGFSDFRAAFTPGTPMDWTVTPGEGSLNGRAGTDFIVRFRPQNPGTTEGYLVIDTEDDKWTYKLIGSTSM